VAELLDLGIRNPKFYAAPHEVLRRWRRDDPVHRDDAAQMWVVTRHDDVLAVLRDPRLFCSSRGVLLGDRERDIAPGQSILYLDPPEHSRYRAIVSRQFHGREVVRLEQRITALVDELLDVINPGEPFDAVERLAVPLPLTMIAELLGLHGSNREQLRAWSDSAIAAAVDPTPESYAHASEVIGHLLEAVAEHRGHPSDDLIGDLLAAEVDGDKLNEGELLGFCMSLLVAGNETTRQLISGSLRALAEHPAQWQRLRNDPLLIPTAVEELLRWTTPFIGFARTATEDCTLGGRDIAAGDYLLLLHLSANRDEEVFGDNSLDLDLGRDPNPHLSFGFGIHYCLGAGLARMEARALLSELVLRFGSVSVAGEPRRLESAFVNGLEELPLVLRT